MAANVFHLDASANITRCALRVWALTAASLATIARRVGVGVISGGVSDSLVAEYCRS